MQQQRQPAGRQQPGPVERERRPVQLLPVRRLRRRFGDLAKQRAEADGLAGSGDDFRKRAGSGCGNFDGHLVGFKLQNRLVGLDGVADLLEPGADGCLADGFTESWNADFCGHCSNPDFVCFRLCVSDGGRPQND